MTENRSGDREFLAGWLLSGIVGWETGQWEVPYNAVEAERLVDDSKIGETMSWLAAMKRLVEASGRQFVVTLIAVGTVDPAYVEFWQPWPRYCFYAPSSDVRHKRLVLAVKKDKMRVIDLRDDLSNVAGT